MERFVAVYGLQLQRLGLWSAANQSEALEQIQAAASDPGSRITTVPPMSPAIARLIMAAAPIS